MPAFGATVFKKRRYGLRWHMARYLFSLVIFAAWWIALAVLLKSITLDVGELPVDYRTYATAAERLGETGSPYVGASGAREGWLAR